jgi:tetratricopeptide (TPR) repeat protein
MAMKRHSLLYLRLCVLTLLAPTVLVAQIPSVQLKVKEKSGLFGISPERFATIALSTQNRSLPLSSENVNAGPFTYFLFRPAGDWQIDQDFVNEELPKLTFIQGEQKFPVMWKGEILSDSGGTSLLLGISKDLKLNQKFLSQFQLGDAASQGEFNIPVEFWPGYTVLMGMLQDASKAVGEKLYREAIPLFEKILARPDLGIFPEHAEVRGKRLQAFDTFFEEQYTGFLTTLLAENLKLKEKITRVESFRPVFQFVVDSLPRPALGITDADPALKALSSRAGTALTKLTSVRDSLQQALDDQNVRWIIDASITGRPSYLYEYIIEALAHGFSSLDFSDTTNFVSRATLPPEIQTQLGKNDLLESYETFLRMAHRRFQRHEPIFPDPFLANVLRDSAAFSLPTYSMLKAVYDFYAGQHEMALVEIFKVFKTSSEPQLSARYDQMRVLIQIREKRIHADVLKLIAEGGEAEQSGNNEVALERYRQATVLAPGFAHALFCLGRFYARANDPIRALTFYQQAYQADTLYLSAYREAYNLYRKGGNYKPMIDVLTQAIQRGNDYWETNINLGFAYMGDGDVARAIEHFQRALLLNPKSYQTNIQLGLAFQTVKDYQKARDYFNKAIAIDPLRQEAVDFLQKLNDLQRAGK